MLPNFLLIGAMKAGTTSVYEYLRSHPQVFLPEKKELDFFAEPSNFARGFAWYEGNFDAADGAIAVGEASTSYTKHPDFGGVPARIAGSLPDVRLIYVIRHPIERMRSHYLHDLLLGEERDPIERALLSRSRYRDFSSYAMQIDRYLEYFSRDRLLVVRAEDLRLDRAAVLRSIWEFLGVDPNWEHATLEREFHRTDEKKVSPSVVRRIVETSAYRRASSFVPSSLKRLARRLVDRGVDHGRGEISPELHERLEDMVREDVRALRMYLGAGFDGWGIA